MLTRTRSAIQKRPTHKQRAQTKLGNKVQASNSFKKVLKRTESIETSQAEKNQETRLSLLSTAGSSMRRRSSTQNGAPSRRQPVPEEVIDEIKTRISFEEFPSNSANHNPEPENKVEETLKEQRVSHKMEEEIEPEKKEATKESATPLAKAENTEMEIELPSSYQFPKITDPLKLLKSVVSGSKNFSDVYSKRILFNLCSKE